MRPLKVTFRLRSPAVLSRVVTLDKLAAAVMYGSARLPQRRTEELLEGVFAFKDGVPCASVYFTRGNVVYHQRFLIFSPALSRDLYREALGGKKVNDQIWMGSGSGAWKQSRSEFVAFYAEELYFYAFADKEKLESVLKKVKYLGKKGKFGFGVVRDVSVDEIEDDKSLFLNEWTPSRPLPVEWGVATNKIALYNIDGPTWFRAGLRPCAMPPLSLRETVYPSRKKPEYSFETVSSTMFTAIHHEGVFEKRNKTVKITKNPLRKPCAACGEVTDGIVELTDGPSSVRSLTSGSFTDYKPFAFTKGACLCEYCAKALSSSWTTTKDTLITRDSIETMGGSEKRNLLGEVIASPPEGEYVYLYHRGMRRHVLVGSLPSVSRSLMFINRPDHVTHLIDPEIVCAAVKILKEHPNFKNLEGHGRVDESEMRDYFEYTGLINPEHALLLKYISKKEVAGDSLCAENQV